MMETSARCLVLMMLFSMVCSMLFSMVCSTPISYHDTDSRPLADLGQRLVSHSSLLEPRTQDPRLPIPTPQDIEAIKKVAQILVMLGEQVIPAIVGDSAPHTNSPQSTVEEIPNDPVEA